MLRSNKMIATLLALLSIFSLNAQTYLVNWTGFKNAEVVNGVLQGESNAGNKGTATSQQLLFGRGQSNVFQGYFEFTATSTNELKKIGFVALDDPDEIVSSITYGFSFLNGGKVKATGLAGVSAEINYNVGDVFRISRFGGRILRYYINGTEVYFEPGDVSQSYQIRAELKSNNATFSNVVCDYQTTPFCVVPEIDNVNKTIRLAISGAYPPYIYTWDHGPVLVGGSTQNPSNEPLYQVQADGNYFVTIKDLIGNTFRKRYSIGSDLAWTNVYQTTVNGDVLSYTGNNNWGSAVHSGSFNQNSTGWVEYVIDHNDGKRAFGFVDATQQVRKTRHLNAGFLITDEAIQVIHNGNIMYTGDYENKDVLTLHYFQGSVVWMKNGIEFFTETYTGSGDLTIAGMLRGTGVEKHLNYSFNTDSYITKTWDDLEEYGDVSVNIASLNVPGPYHYIISKDRIPELFETYSYLKDSVGIEIDSVKFFNGSESGTSFMFSDLEAGTYNVAVFDSQGGRIFGQEVELYGDLSVESGAGLIVSGNTIQASQDGAAGSLELYLTQGENLGMEIEVNRTGGNIEQFIGLSAELTTVNGYQDLEYGFYLDGRRLYTVQDGVLSSNFEIIRQNKTLKITIENGQLVLNANMEDLVTVQLPAQYTYKVGTGMDQGAMLKLNFPGKPPKKIKYRFYPSVINHLNCDDQAGSFSFNINAFGTANSLTIPYTITNLDNGQFVSSGTVNNQQNILPITSYQNGNPLDAGVYTVDLTIAGQVYSHQICLGYEADWDDQLNVDYVESPNNYSLLRQLAYTGNFSTARARNILLNGVNGWIEFTPLFGNGTSGNLLRLSAQNPTSAIPTSAEDYLLFFPFGNSILIYANLNQSTSIATIQGGERLKIIQIGNQLDVVNGSTSLISETVSPQTRLIRGQSLELNDGFRDMIVSFPCEQKKLAYAKLERKLKGVKYKASNGVFRFYVTEEYNSQSEELKYRVYPEGDKLNAALDGGTQVENVQYGDNRYDLDVSSISSGVYILEVENEKKEKFYLRFVK